MMSFDVTALFTSIPLEPTLDFLGRKIDEGQICIPIPKDAFLELIRLCVGNMVFQCKGAYYRQKFEVAIRSPLSPVLANLFKEMFEMELLITITVRPII